jgi:hypothetical protein
MNISIENASIKIGKYPYKPSTVFPGTVIQASEMEKIAIDLFPPVLYLKNNDVIFLSRAAVNDAQLICFCENNKISCVKKQMCGAGSSARFWTRNIPKRIS